MHLPFLSRFGFIVAPPRRRPSCRDRAWSGKRRRMSRYAPERVRRDDAVSFPSIWSSVLRRKVGLLAFAFVVTVPAPAHAYLDPGSVSLALQAIVAALAGAALTWKTWYWRLRSLLTRDRKRMPNAGDSGHRPRAPGDTDTPPGE